MDNNTQQQILNLIEKSQSILLLTHAKADCDGLGSMISMYMTLQRLGKDVVAATNDPAPEALSFLPGIQMVQHSVSSNNFVIALDISRTPLDKIKYKLSDDKSKINIIVTPKSGHFKPEDVNFGREEGSFDLIMVFDTGNLEHLGPIYDQNSELFFKTPVINIDHHASNTDYGQVNYVDVVAASTTEVMIGVLEAMESKYDQKFIDEDVATLLLAGLITDTGSFQHANTSPRAMEVAAKLLGMGARQQEIIKNIYKTKKLSTLKLWGTILSKVQTDPIYRLVWSDISKNDLMDTGATTEESEGLIDDLLSNAPGAEVIMLFKYNEEGYVSVSMRSTTNSVDVGKICSDMGGGGHVRAAGFKRRDGSSLEKLIEDTLVKVRAYQGERLNIHPDTVHQPVTEAEPVIKTEPTPPKKEEKVDDSMPQKVQYLDFEAPKNEAKEEKNKPEKQAKKDESKKEKPKSDKKGPKSGKKSDKSAKNDSKDNQKKDSNKGRSQKKDNKSVEQLKKDFVSRPTPKKEEIKPVDKALEKAPAPKTEQTQTPKIGTPAPKTTPTPPQTPNMAVGTPTPAPGVSASPMPQNTPPASQPMTPPAAPIPPVPTSAPPATAPLNPVPVSPPSTVNTVNSVAPAPTPQQPPAQTPIQPPTQNQTNTQGPMAYPSSPTSATPPVNPIPPAPNDGQNQTPEIPPAPLV